jgi:hypothetical protein
MGMAGLPDAAFSRCCNVPIYRSSAMAGQTLKVTTMNASNTDFRKALDGVITARSREATRQVVRANEFQLIGAITKRPN